jgi:hypothetical protein
MKKPFLILYLICSILNGNIAEPNSQIVEREFSESCTSDDLIQRTQPRSDPMGCYALKSNSEETLNGLSNLSLLSDLKFLDPYRDKDGKLMDPGLCTKHCSNYNFTLAALRNGKDCRCGEDNALQAYNKVDDTNCDITCVGSINYKVDDKTYICGGKESYTIYNTTSEIPDNKKPKITVKEKIDIIHNLANNSRYQRCIKDGPYCKQRVLNFHMAKLDSMTIDYCIKLCGSKGYKFAGLEIGDECYCGDAFDSSSSLRPEECSNSCVGNKYQVCGGPLALSVYNASTPNEVPSSPPKSSGLSKGEIAGIAAGSVGGAIIIVGGVYGVYLVICKST